MTQEAIDRECDQIRIGLRAEFECTVTDELIRSFTTYSGDYNPLHNVKEFARACGYRDVVAHGAIQQALLSRLVGMYLPGRRALIKKVNTQYITPVFAGDALVIQGEIIQWRRDIAMGALQAKITANAGTLVSMSVVEFGLTQVAGVGTDTRVVKPSEEARGVHGGARRLLVFGGTSGVASAVFPGREWGAYSIVRVGRKRGKVDIEYDPGGNVDEELGRIIQEVAPYGILQFSSLHPTKQPIDEMDLTHLFENIRVHILPLKVAAQMVMHGHLQGLRRIVMMGSFGARHLSPEKGFESYAYAKSVASFFCRDVAREVARFGVTCNCIAPAEINAGINAGVPERMKAMLAARSPMNRLIGTDDIARAIEFLLSENAEAVSGQEIVLAGGRSWI